LSNVYDVFHVSQLKKCLRVPEEKIPMEDLDAKEDLSYQEYHINILETSERVTRNKRIKMCNMQWSHHAKEEATWKREEELKAEFLCFFNNPSELGDEIHLKGVRFLTPYFSQKNKTLRIYLFK
jgi:hypothetical protein